MCLVIILLIDVLLGRNQLSNVHSRCFGKVLKEIGQLLHLIIEVVRLAHGLLIELLDALVPCARPFSFPVRSDTSACL